MALAYQQPAIADGSPTPAPEQELDAQNKTASEQTPLLRSKQAGKKKTNKKSQGKKEPLASRAQFQSIGGAVNTWAIFGFTDGSDVGSKGERSPFQETVIRFSRQGADFKASRTSVGVSY